MQFSLMENDFYRAWRDRDNGKRFSKGGSSIGQSRFLASSPRVLNADFFRSDQCTPRIPVASRVSDSKPVAKSSTQRHPAKLCINNRWTLAASSVQSSRQSCPRNPRPTWTGIFQWFVIVQTHSVSISARNSISCNSRTIILRNLSITVAWYPHSSNGPNPLVVGEPF